MEESKRDLYYKGYIAGYRDAIADAANGKLLNMTDNTIAALPIEALGLSTRAFNCLIRAGCVHVADVAALSDYAIATMRSLGSKTASEIARCLDAHGICCSNWSRYM